MCVCVCVCVLHKEHSITDNHNTLQLTNRPVTLVLTGGRRDGEREGRRRKVRRKDKSKERVNKAEKRGRASERDKRRV